MTKDHGPTVKNDKQYEGLREKGMSKSRAAAISNSPGASSRGGRVWAAARVGAAAAAVAAETSLRRRPRAARAVRNRASPCE